MYLFRHTGLSAMTQSTGFVTKGVPSLKSPVLSLLMRQTHVTNDNHLTEASRPNLTVKRSCPFLTGVNSNSLNHNYNSTRAHSSLSIVLAPGISPYGSPRRRVLTYLSTARLVSEDQNRNSLLPFI